MGAFDEKRAIERAAVLEALKTVADGIAGMFGSHCEVLVHDLQKVDASIVKIVNGHVTGRHIGGCMTDFGLEIIKRNSTNLLLNYATNTEDGRRLKSGGMIFRDQDGQPIAMLCINFDPTGMVNLDKLKEALFPSEQPVSNPSSAETFQENLSGTLHEVLRKAIDKTGTSVISMKKGDRLKVVTELESRGFFLMKGAVNHLARKMKISKFTVYSDLEEIRANRVSAEFIPA
jgi:predicted transcriptional regulator YheO